MAVTENSRIIKASRDKVWDLIADMENWSNWAPNAKNRVVYHHIIEKTQNVLICEEIEQISGFFKGTKHIDKYILTPKVKMEEVLIEGYHSGQAEITLSDSPEGTLAVARADITPKETWLKIVYFFVGGMLLHRFWDDFLAQLAAIAENA